MLCIVEEVRKNDAYVLQNIQKEGREGILEFPENSLSDTQHCY